MRTLHSRRCDPFQGRLGVLPTVSDGIASLDHRLSCDPVGVGRQWPVRDRSQESAIIPALFCGGRGKELGMMPERLAPNSSPLAPLPRHLTITVHVIKSHGQRRAGTAQPCGFAGCGGGL
jgi:hypothetical protein